MGKLIHKLDYIYWKKEAKMVNLKYEEFKKFYKTLDKSKRVRWKTKRSDFKVGCWTYRKDDNYAKLSIHEDVGKYVMYICNLFDDNKNNHKIQNVGRRALKGVRNQFFEKYGVKMFKAFGTVEKDFLKCVPSQFYYKGKYDKVIDYVSSVDFNSHYPSCICGKLPNANEYLVEKGTVKPNNEYPFAFYLESGHVAEYNVFDTHNWIGNEYEYCLFKKHYPNKYWEARLDKTPYINPDDDITVLMKASKYELTSIYEINYALRKVKESAKLIMNSSIGEMHTIRYKEDKYAHLAAICLGRANQKILDVANKIGRFYIIQICVDGIMYKGTKEYGTKDKQLGTLTQEYTSKSCFYGGTNKYIITELKSPNLPIKWKCSGCNYKMDGTKLDEKYVPKSYYEVEEWVKKDKDGELYGEEEV